MAMVCIGMPSRSHSSAASVLLPADEYIDGSENAVTRSGPSARAARAATSAESIPPDTDTCTRSWWILRR